jgi:uncharacterized protein (TIGR02271 family)
MSSDIDWNDTIKKEARGSSDEDLGEVQAIVNGYIEVQRGLINKEKFYIPQNKVESYDGSVLRFHIAEGELSKYAGDSSPPSIEDQYASTTLIDRGGGSGGGIKVDEPEEYVIPQGEENLNVSKNIAVGQTTTAKEPVTETKTVDVPVTHEEITIETRPPSGQTEAQTPVSSTQNITIPIKKEEVEVNKRLVKETDLSKEVASENITSSDAE